MNFPTLRVPKEADIARIPGLLEQAGIRVEKRSAPPTTSPHFVLLEWYKCDRDRAEAHVHIQQVNESGVVKYYAHPFPQHDDIFHWLFGRDRDRRLVASIVKLLEPISYDAASPRHRGRMLWANLLWWARELGKVAAFIFLLIPLFIVLILPIMIVVGGSSFVYQEVKEGLLRKRMRHRGRFLDEKELESKLARGEGTVILQYGAHHASYHWWTPDDIVQTAPVPLPQSLRQLKESQRPEAEERRYKEYVAQFVARYLDEEQGSASLTWYSKQVRNKFPETKVVTLDQRDGTAALLMGDLYPAVSEKKAGPNQPLQQTGPA